MQSFTDTRDDDTVDELWLVEHPPVFTLGRNAKQEHIHDTGEIPLIQVDRGGQVTYHGPGQLLAYVLLDLKRRGMGVQSLVRRLEQAVIDLLAGWLEDLGFAIEIQDVTADGAKANLVATLGSGPGGLVLAHNMSSPRPDPRFIEAITTDPSRIV